MKSYSLADLLLEKRYADLHNGQKEVLRVVQGGEAKLQGTWMDEKLHR